MRHSNHHKSRGSAEGHSLTFSACSLMSVPLLPDDLPLTWIPSLCPDCTGQLAQLQPTVNLNRRGIYERIVYILQCLGRNRELRTMTVSVAEIITSLVTKILIIITQFHSILTLRWCPQCISLTSEFRTCTRESDCWNSGQCLNLATRELIHGFLTSTLAREDLNDQNMATGFKDLGCHRWQIHFLLVYILTCWIPRLSHSRERL